MPKPDGVVYVGSWDHNVFALNAESGVLGISLVEKCGAFPLNACGRASLLSLESQRPQLSTEG
jgi:hypothetical protein